MAQQAGWGREGRVPVGMPAGFPYPGCRRCTPSCASARPGEELSAPPRPAAAQLSPARLGAARLGMAWLLLLAGAALLAPAAASEVTAEGKWLRGAGRGSARLCTPRFCPSRAEPGDPLTLRAVPAEEQFFKAWMLQVTPRDPWGGCGAGCAGSAELGLNLPRPPLPAARAALRGGRIRAAAAGLRGQQAAHRGAQRREQLLPEYERQFCPSPPPTSFCFRFAFGLQ